MANDGRSSDNVLARSVTSGWRRIGNSWAQDPQRLPKHKEDDDIHQTALKNYLYDYYNIFHSFDEHSETSVQNNKHKLMTNIIYKMNQYRQKNWYWKAIQ